MNRKEKEMGCQKIIRVDQQLFQVAIQKPDEPSAEPKCFTFDAVYDDDSTQREVYDEVAFPLVQSVMSGYNGTIFAYGQTGCGKTFSMEGLRNPPEMRGIIPNAFDHVFDSINENTVPDRRYLVTAAYIEIYNEDVRDLLGPDPKAKLDVKESKDKGFMVAGLTYVGVSSAEQIHDLMIKGNGNRTVGETAMNATSSRSHSIFMLTIETSEPDGAGDQRIHQGKLNLVDLAGSERQSKTRAEGQRLKEANNINLSLSALGQVIEKLVKQDKHIPYRNSKLTKLLADSLGGNTKTVMLTAISPAEYNFDETLSSLRYANRAKNIKNKPRVNEDPKDAMLRQYQDEINKLKELLAQQNIDYSSLSSVAGLFESRFRKLSIAVVRRLTTCAARSSTK